MGALSSVCSEERDWIVKRTAVGIITGAQMQAQHRTRVPIHTLFTPTLTHRIFAGGWHALLYKFKAQGSERKYDPKWQATDTPKFLFRDQVCSDCSDCMDGVEG